MKKTCFPAIFLAFLLSFPAIGNTYAASSAPTLACSPNSQGDRQTLRLDGVPAGCYGVELTLSVSGGKGYRFDFDSALSSDGNYSVEKQKDGSITLYAAAGKEPLNAGGSLTLGTLSADGAFSIGSVSGKLVDGDMQEQAQPSISVKKDASGSGGNAGSSARYTVSIADAEGGTVEASPAKAGKGTTVTLSVLPDDGFFLDSLTVVDKGGDEIRLSEQSPRRYTFSMPASDVSITPVFEEGEEPERPSAPSDSTPLPFRDVPENEWFAGAVRYVYANGMMSGTDAALFSPNVTTTRGMIVTILYRLEGRPSVTAAPFVDVPASQYYAPSVAWASENSIVSGYGDGVFGPEDTISREQMASILYRYARYKGYDMDGAADLSGYADAGSISPYAMPALQWANANNLVSGTTPTTLNPGGSATRAQVASILMRFCENIAK